MFASHTALVPVVERFINVMWRELDMLICQRPASGTASAQTLDDLFGGEAN